MKDQDRAIFITLFKDACKKCFGFPLSGALSESDCKLFSTRIFEETGLVIGAKSIKNYSFYVSGADSKGVKEENPSVATLDTLARYVLNAPYTDELKRKDKESHYPYWFQYRDRFSDTLSRKRLHLPDRRRIFYLFLIALTILTAILVLKSLKLRRGNEIFTDNFNSVGEDSLKSRGWFIKSADTSWWERRGERPGHLSLYTLRGDNWSNDENPARIRNLLMRSINPDCFMAEIHLSNFIPRENWQQAGILLSEDSTFKSKMLRLSIAYNDYFGGYEKPAEIIIQAVSSSESGWLSKPEEIAHFPLFIIEAGKENLVENNLAESALKIEKKGNHFRFLYTASPVESFTFREVVSGDFNMRPRYISIFAIEGWSENMKFIPAYFDSFILTGINCKE